MLFTNQKKTKKKNLKFLPTYKQIYYIFYTLYNYIVLLQFNVYSYFTASPFLFVTKLFVALFVVALVKKATRKIWTKIIVTIKCKRWCVAHGFTWLILVVLGVKREHTFFYLNLLLDEFNINNLLYTTYFLF